jgi:peptidoglycan hydrolase-like protein with peptidoglycan-binding domain
MRRAWRAVLGASVAFAVSCTGDIAEPQGAGTQAAVHTHDDGSMVAALSLGATGPEVAELQDYLMQYGYFPNDELVERFPDWVSVSALSPEAGVFDETTEDAVRSFQARNGLEATGIVGPETRQVMNQARCGNPDSFEQDADSKFAIKLEKWPASKRNFTWRAIDPSECKKWDGSEWISCFSASNPAPATREQLRQLANAAFALWSAETDITFTESSNATTDLSFAWTEFHLRDCKPDPKPAWCKHGIVTDPNSALAVAVNTFRSTTKEIVRSDIVFNYQRPMAPTHPMAAHQHDMLAITLHEVGHSLGLDHSSADQVYGIVPVMKPGIGPGPNELRTLSVDDTTAISARYDKWNTRPGLATDIAAGGDGSFWHIGTAATGDGFRIYKWSSFTRVWEEASGNGGAVRIAVAPDGTPWVTTSTGAVFNHSRNHQEGGWHHVPNLCALDIGIGGDGSVWFVTCNQDNEDVVGGYKVGKLVIVPITADSAWIGIHEVPGSTHATRISVGKHGHPWIVNLFGDVYWGSPDPSVLGWSHVGGVKAADISLSPRDYAYVTGTGANVGRLYILNFQPQVKNDEGQIIVHARNEWYELARLPTGTPSTIAAGSRTVWATNTSKAMFEQTAK